MTFGGFIGGLHSLILQDQPLLGFQLPRQALSAASPAPLHHYFRQELRNAGSSAAWECRRRYAMVGRSYRRLPGPP